MVGDSIMKLFVGLMLISISAQLCASENELKEINNCNEVSSTGLSKLYRNCSGTKVFGESKLVSELSIEKALTHLQAIKSRPRDKEELYKDELLNSFQSIHGLFGIEEFFSANNSIVLIFENGVQLYYPYKKKWKLVEFSR